MIGIIDYNAGNIKSVERALKFLDIDYFISKDPAKLINAEKIIFPGVGEAKYAMEQLKKNDCDKFLKNFSSSGKYILGICLGSQIIFEHSQEGNVKCLGLLKGSIVHFDNLFLKENDKQLKVPHMGWNDIDFENSSTGKKHDIIFNGIPNNSNFYFVHSYVIQPKDESIVLAHCNYGIKVPSVIKKDNIYAFQFHPEKSGKVGLKLLKNFCDLPYTNESSIYVEKNLIKKTENEQNPAKPTFTEQNFDESTSIKTKGNSKC
ncbi:MAG: imidazole glycerol phosphate synthase subunit HisH [Treponemataceae bacterium]